MMYDALVIGAGPAGSTAARLLTPMRQWKRYDADRRALMEEELKRILGTKDISNDVYEIVSKSLN